MAIWSWPTLAFLLSFSLMTPTLLTPATFARADFTPVYHQGDPGTGIGGYDLADKRDRMFAFDYSSSGKVDHLCLYRPGTGTFWILDNSQGNFAPLYRQGDPGNGIGGYDLASNADLAFAFDYDHSGKMDHLCLYRPGTGAFFILKNEEGTFIPVYRQGAPGQGIGGYDLADPRDRAFAFDFRHTGKNDHICLYRPGEGTFWILQNINGAFSPVYREGSPGNGIGGYDLKSNSDRAFAFDYTKTGKQDHIVLYRPGTGAIFILQHANGIFTPVYSQDAPGNGIGGYDLKGTTDMIVPFDYNHSGKQTFLVPYRPGAGAIFILHHQGSAFSPVYAQGFGGSGIGGYDLQSVADRAFAFDYDSSGKADHLVLYRPGTGTVWILRH